MHFSLTPKSRNEKTGKIPVGMSDMSTCPPSCKLSTVCYAKGRMLMVWNKLSDGNLRSAEPFSDFCASIRSLGPETEIWRHNQAGDLPGRNDRLHKGKCLQLARANSAGGRNRGGFTFTHYPVLQSQAPGVSDATLAHNRAVVAEMNRLGFTVSLSADSVDQVDDLVGLGIGPVAVLLPRDAEKGLRTASGNRVAICPAARTKHAINCAECRLCQRQDRAVIGFPAHGNRVRMADAVAKEGACNA